MTCMRRSTSWRSNRAEYCWELARMEASVWSAVAMQTASNLSRSCCTTLITACIAQHHQLCIQHCVHRPAAHQANGVSAAHCQCFLMGPWKLERVDRSRSEVTSADCAAVMRLLMCTHSGTGPAKLVRGRLTGLPGGEPTRCLLPVHSNLSMATVAVPHKGRSRCRVCLINRGLSQLQLTHVRYLFGCRGPGSAACAGHEEAREQRALEEALEGARLDDMAHTDPA